MTILGISWLWWLLSTFGLGGTVIIVWFFPAVAVKIGATLLNFFLTNRWGNMLGVAIVVFIVADINRSLRDEHEFAARTAAFEQEQHARDERIAAETRITVQAEMAAQAKADTKTDTEVKDFTNALPPVPFADSNPFRVGPDACKLRALAGQPGCGPQSVPRRVQKVGAPAAPQPDHGGFGLPAALGRILGRDQKDTGGTVTPQ